MKTVKTRLNTAEDSSSLWNRLAPTMGLIGVCAYVVGSAFPLPWDISLIVMAGLGMLAMVSVPHNRSISWSPLTFAVLGFMVATGLSTLVSVDIGRSVRLSAPLLPGMLLFFLVADHCEGPQNLRFLSLTLSAVGLALASMILWTGWRWQAWHIKTEVIHHVVLDVGSPLLIVPNDSILLAVIAPLSFVLLCCAPHKGVRVLAALSLLGTLGAIVMLQSRTAFLTFVVTLVCAAMLLWPRRQWKKGFLWGVTLLGLVLCVDGSMEFPLATKFSHMYVSGDGRIPLWSAAWAMFLEAPLLGHGPHTFNLFHQIPWPHNLYLEVLAEQGLIGLTALGFLLASGLCAASRLQRTATEERRRLAVAALAGLIGFCSAAVVELSLARQWVVIVLFTLLGVVAQLSSSQTVTRGEVNVHRL